MTKDPPQIIYHYTSQEGLLGILATKRVWATDILFLNDSSEFQHTLSLTNALLVPFIKTLEAEDLCLVEEMKRMLLDFAGHRVFVTSFSEHGDLPSQWTRYASNGLGYSIGFNSQGLIALAAGQGFILRDCLYKEEDKLRLITRDLYRSLEYFREHRRRGEAPFETPQKCAVFCSLEFYVAMLMAAPSLKHSSFTEEAEWRLAGHITKVDLAALQFRCTPSHLVPYIEVDLSCAPAGIPLVEIVMGPRVNHELARRSLHDAFKKYGIAPPPVKASKVPLRA